MSYNWKLQLNIIVSWDRESLLLFLIFLSWETFSAEQQSSSLSLASSLPWDYMRVSWLTTVQAGDNSNLEQSEGFSSLWIRGQRVIPSLLTICYPSHHPNTNCTKVLLDLKSWLKIILGWCEILFIWIKKTLRSERRRNFYKALYNIS